MYLAAIEPLDKAASQKRTGEAGYRMCVPRRISRLRGQKAVSYTHLDVYKRQCFDSAIDAEHFAAEKSAIFLVLPEEDSTKNFMAGLMIQNLSRELFSVADEHGGKPVSYTHLIGKLLLKQAVEQNVCNHILASDTDIDAQTFQQMRGKSYQEVLRTNGQISFPEVLRQQRQL